MSNYLLSNYSRIPITFTHGKGSWLYASNKKKYLDFASGIAVNCLGHSNDILIKALKLQSKKLWHTSNLYKIKEQEDLAKKLCKNSFADKVFFCNSGAEATEGTIKIIRKFHFVKGNHKKKKIIVFDNAFHGRTLSGILAGSSVSHREGFLPSNKSTGAFVRINFNNTKDLINIIDKETAGVFLEPIQGEGGINVASYNFLKQVRKICNQHKILLALDEVQCGIGRTGKLFAHEWSDIKPDLLTSAKGLGGGFPIGAILLNNKVSKVIKPGSHGSTFGGNQLACAVSLAVIKEVSKKKLLQNVITLGNYLNKELSKFTQKYPKVISQIFGKGLMIGIKCKVPNNMLSVSFRNKGLLVVTAANNVIRLLPPLNITKREADKAIHCIDEAISDFK